MMILKSFSRICHALGDGGESEGHLSSSCAFSVPWSIVAITCLICLFLPGQLKSQSILSSLFYVSSWTLSMWLYVVCLELLCNVTSRNAECISSAVIFLSLSSGRCEVQLVRSSVCWCGPSLSASPPVIQVTQLYHQKLDH